MALILGISFAIGFALGIGEVLVGVPENEYLKRMEEEIRKKPIVALDDNEFYLKKLAQLKI